MATVMLVRHGRTSANASGVLAGWTPGVTLDDAGLAQAEATGKRLAKVPLDAIVTSPLERTVETARIVGQQHGREVPLHEDERLAECRYGDWTGQELKSLAKDPMWKVVQGHPSAMVFPGGESMVAMQARAVEAVRDWNGRLGERAVWVAVSHGDVIKAILADALGMHLDAFQRIQVDPGSVSVINYTPVRPFVMRLNDTGGGFGSFAKRRRRRGSDAAVGGGSGQD